MTARLSYDDFEVQDAFAYPPPPSDVGCDKPVGNRQVVGALGEDRDEVAAGLSVALVVRGEKAGLVLSIMHAQQEGAAFEGPLLRQAEVLEYPSTPR